MPSPQEILAQGAETYEKKNKSYGDSWRMVGRFLHMLAGPDGITLETEEDFISFGLFTRRLDKLARAYNGEFNDDDLNFESVMDSHEDECVYSAMAAANQADRTESGTAEEELISTLSNISNDEPDNERSEAEGEECGINHTTVTPENTGQ